MATRMQQRRGLASQWISTNSGNGPILAAGEIGFESDTNKFKIGDGINHWVNLVYFTDAASALAAINAVIDAAPAALNTLNELAAAINDDPSFFTTIATNLSNHESDTTNVHGIADTSLLATKSYADTAVSTHSSDTTGVHGIADTAELATKEYVTQEIGNAEVDQAELAGTGLTWDGPNQQFAVNTTLIQERVDGVSDTEIGYLSNVTSDIQSQIDGKLASADLDEAAQEAVNTALVAGTGLEKTYDDLANTININVDSTIATKIYADDAAQAADDSARGYADSLASNYDPSGSATTAENNAKAYAEDYTDTALGNLGGTGTAFVAGNLDVLTGTGIAIVNNAVEVDFQELDTRYDALNAADAAEQAANLYTDGAIEDLDLANTYDAKGAAAAVAGNLTSHESDTSTHGVGTIVGTSEVQTLTNKTISHSDNTITVQVANVSDLTATATELNTLDGITASTAELNYVSGVTSSVQDQLDDKAPLASPTFTGTTTTDDLVVDGDFTINGTNFAASATSITIEDNMVQLAHQNPSNTVDLGIVVGYNDGTAKHAGLVKDTSESKWKLFKDVTTEPATTVDFTQGSLDTLAVATLEGNVTGNLTGDVTGNADTATALETARTIAGQSFDGTANINIAPTDLTDVTATAAEINILDGATLSTTELNYVEGVTSSIQDQIDTKIATSTAASTYAPIESPAFTGVVSGITKSMVGLGNVDDTADADKPVSTDVQAELDLKADINAPTFTGSVTLPETTAIGNVSSTEIGYINGLSSAVQDQLDDKAPLASPTFTGTVDFTGATVNGISSYSAPTLGSTSIASGATVTTVDGLTLNNSTLTGTLSTQGQLINSTPALYAAGLNKAYFVKSYNGFQWTQVPNPGVCYNSLVNMNGVLASVGTISNSVATNGGLIYSVNNGVSWIQRVLPASDLWAGGAYINGRYVVVGRSNAPHSTDLISWTNVTLPDLGAPGGFENAWSNVEEVNGRLYAYRTTGGIYTDNGTTWSEITFPFSIRDIVYANNKYTITGTNAVASSTDGLTNWVTQSMPSNGTWGPIEHANGTYVIFKDSTTTAAYSTDAITWTEVGYGSTGYSFDDVGYINGRFIALPANSIDLVYSSTDGVTWISYPKSLAAGEGFNSILTMTDTTYVSGLELGFLDGTTSPVQSQLDVKAPLVSPTFTGTVTLPTGSVTSTMIQDGTIVNADISGTAAIAQSKIANLTSDLATVGASNLFVAVSGTFTSVAASSTDGITWTQRTLPSVNNWLSATYGEGLFVATSNSGSLATSTDGITWTQRTMPANTEWHTVFYGNGTFVSFAAGNTIAASSTDGITWTQRTLPSAHRWTKGIYANGRFVAMRDENGGSLHNTLALSTDGITWTAGTLPSSRRWSSLTYGNGVFAAIAAYDTTSAISTDGITWTTGILTQNTNWKALTFGNGVFVAVSQSNQSGPVNVSTDGFTWTVATLPNNSYGWNRLSFANGIFNVWSYSQFADQTSMASSTDGITWTLRAFPTQTKWADVAAIPSYVSRTTSIVGASQQPLTNTAYSVSTNDKYLTFNTSSTVTLTLPQPGTFPGREIYVKQVGSSSIVSSFSNIVPLDSQTPGISILSGTTKSVVLVSDGYNWIVYGATSQAVSVSAPTFHTVFAMV